MATISLYSNISALIIDDMASQQTTLRGLLTTLGVTRVEVASNADAALRQIARKRFSLILCDYNLNAATDGQQLLEHLRENQLLPPDCQFFMITAEAAYASVASATEHRPDGYLLKPVTAGNIGERLGSQLERRHALRDVYQRMQRQNWVEAVHECDKLLSAGNRWSMAALQLKGQALLQLGRHEGARAVFEKALAVRSGLTWAQIGLARACKAAHQLDESIRITSAVLDEPEGAKNAEAFDLLAECHEEKGNVAEALKTLQRSAEVLPSARRQRMVAECAYRHGDLVTAKASYARVVKATRGSIAANVQDGLALAQTLVDCGDMKEALALLDEEARGNATAVGAAALALRGQALHKLGDADGAKAFAGRARSFLTKGRADFSTLAVAKLALQRGETEAGLSLLQQAIRADHENKRFGQLVSHALSDTGHEAERERLVEDAIQGIKNQVNEAKSQFLSGHTAEALSLIESALSDVPENTGVLLQAAQMSCMALRMSKQSDNTTILRVQRYLDRLDKLMPCNDRVMRMRRYFSETVTMLEPQAA